MKNKKIYAMELNEECLIQLIRGIQIKQDYGDVVFEIRPPMFNTNKQELYSKGLRDGAKIVERFNFNPLT